MEIIAIHDGHAGHISQLKGVLADFKEESADSSNINIIQAKNLWLNRLPQVLMEKFLFTLANSKEFAILKDNTSPQLIISIGRKSLPYAIYLKKKYPKAKLVFLMPSGFLSQKYGDLIFYHSYKQKNYHDSKYVPIITAPHDLSVAKIKESLSNCQNIFANYKKPIISVLIGGSAKKIKLTHAAIDDLLLSIFKVQQTTGGSIFITTSRRTGKQNEEYIKSKLQNLINANKCFFWGYYQQSSQTNPYHAILGAADYVVITGESISMISEAVSLSANTGVYIFFSKNYYAKRYTKFHENLYANNYALPLSEFSVNTARKSLNITKFAVECIFSIL
ncbi:MAG: mitochondrial fission ELM1 family protein [Alphaproteobacteria bacterium]|nr:mitochondrial fission ELM1 family protein [Alphaproteobacteria bacterium]